MNQTAFTWMIVIRVTVAVGKIIWKQTLKSMSTIEMMYEMMKKYTVFTQVEISI